MPVRSKPNILKIPRETREFLFSIGLICLVIAFFILYTSSYHILTYHTLEHYEGILDSYDVEYYGSSFNYDVLLYAGDEVFRSNSTDYAPADDIHPILDALVGRKVGIEYIYHYDFRMDSLRRNRNIVYGLSSENEKIIDLPSQLITRWVKGIKGSITGLCLLFVGIHLVLLSLQRIYIRKPRKKKRKTNA